MAYCTDVKTLSSFIITYFVYCLHLACITVLLLYYYGTNTVIYRITTVVIP